MLTVCAMAGDGYAGFTWAHWRTAAARESCPASPHVARLLDVLIQNHLEKDREVRAQSAAELRAELKRIQRGLSQSMTAAAVRPRRLQIWLAVVLAATAIAIASWYRTRRPAAPSWKNATFAQLTNQLGEELYPNLSPDGKSIVYASRAAGNWDIYFQRVGGQNPINLTKDSPADDIQTAFSPDGERIAFRSERDGGGIFVMGATGESVKRLTDFGFNPAWSPDGQQIVCATGSIVGPENRVS